MGALSCCGLLPAGGEIGDRDLAHAVAQPGGNVRSRSGGGLRYVCVECKGNVERGGAPGVVPGNLYLLKCLTFSSNPVTLDPCYLADQDARRAVTATLTPLLSQ
jgi:hypothetical protein